MAISYKLLVDESIKGNESLVIGYDRTEVLMCFSVYSVLKMELEKKKKKALT